MSSVYYTCQTCDTNQLKDGLCPKCRTVLDRDFDEIFYGGIYDKTSGDEQPKEAPRDEENSADQGS